MASTGSKMNIGEMKNSEFVGLVADLLELNLKALDRTQEVVADHVSGCGRVTPERARPGAEESRSGAARPPPAGATVPRGPALRTGYRMAQKAALRDDKAKKDGRGARHKPAEDARRPSMDSDVMDAAIDANFAMSGVGGRTSDVKVGRGSAASKRSASRGAAPLHTCSALGSGVKSRKSQRHVDCLACRGRGSARSVSIAGPHRAKVCADSGRLVEVQTIDLRGATAAERTTLYHRVLDTVDVVIKAPVHPTLQQYYSTHRMPRSLLVHKEYIPLPCLATQAKKMTGLFKREEVRHVLREILAALEPLHAAGLAHGCLRPWGVFWDHKARAVKVSTPLLDWAAKVNTPGWVAKEGMYLSPQGLAEARAQESPGITPPLPAPPADVWAVGCLMMELLTGARPWRHLGGLREATRAVIEVGGAPLPLPPGIEGDAGAFMSACLAQEAEERPTVADLLRHPYLLPPCGTVAAAESVLGLPHYVDPAADQTLAMQAPSSPLLRAETDLPPAALDVAAGSSGGAEDGDDGITFTKVKTYTDIGVSPGYPTSSPAKQTPTYLSRRVPTPAPLNREALEVPGTTASITPSAAPAYSSPALSSKNPSFVDRTATVLSVVKAPSAVADRTGLSAKALTLNNTPSMMASPTRSALPMRTPTGSTVRVRSVPQREAGPGVEAKVLTTLSDKVVETEHRLHRFEECLHGMVQRQDATNGILEQLTQQTLQLSLMTAKPEPTPAPQVPAPHQPPVGYAPPAVPYQYAYPPTSACLTQWTQDRYAITAPIVVSR